MTRRLLTGWGRTAPTSAEVVTATTEADVVAALRDAGARGVIGRGLGRSYGDAAQNAGGVVVDCTGLDGPITVAADGLVTAPAGASFDRVIAELVPQGWFVPVSPGTRQVTMGGAVGSDIHGKNHEHDGTFCHHVTRLRMVVPGGALHEIGPDQDPELFWATAGGMGLTGVVTEVTFRALPIETSRVRVDTDRCADFDELVETMTAGAPHHRYSVAWIDLLARGSATGRAVLTQGDHAAPDDLPPRRRHDPLAYSAPGTVSSPPAPSGLLNRLTVRAANEAWFRKAPKQRHGQLQSIPAYFHPLDMLGGWNRLYGRRGLLQYQLVVPLERVETMRHVVERFRDTGIGSLLAVLKRMGAQNPGPLSFPMAGWTLTLDIAVGSPRLPALLDELDELVADAGGRVYLSKDSRLRAELLPVMYPRLDEWRAVRARIDPDGVLRSDLARRMGL